MINTIESFEKSCQEALKKNFLFIKIIVSILVTIYGLAMTISFYYIFPILNFNNSFNTILSIANITMLLFGFVTIITFYSLFKKLIQHDTYVEEGKKQKQLDIIDFKNELENNNVTNYKCYNKNIDRAIIMVEKNDKLYFVDPK